MALGAWLLTIAIVAPLTPAHAGAGAGCSFKDGFSSNQYIGNEGSDDFDGPWWESLDWGGSNKGAVSVVESDDCPRTSCARIGGETTFWGAGLARRADLQDAHNATMTFRYRLAIDEASDGYLNVAAFDGWNWTILDSIALDDENDDEIHSRSYNVADYATKFYSVGFFAHGAWSGSAFIDDVEVFGKRQDTTTTTAARTATTVPPTVTTRPPSTEAPLTNDKRYKDKGALAFFVFDDELTTSTGELATMPGEVELPSPGPVTQIMASITVTAVTIRSHLLSAIVLGLLIAAAAVIGLGRREPA